MQSSSEKKIIIIRIFSISAQHFYILLYGITNVLSFVVSGQSESIHFLIVPTEDWEGMRLGVEYELVHR